MSSRKKFNLAVPEQEAAFTQFINEIVDGENSDIEIDIDEDLADDDEPYIPSSESDSEDETDRPELDTTENHEHTQPSSGEPSNTDCSSRRLYWKTSQVFQPLPPAPDYCPPGTVPLNLPPHDYVSKYIPNDIYSKIVRHSNEKYMQETGRNLGMTEKEIKIFFGITLIMSYLKYPRIRQYWETKYRVPAIANRMSRDRYFKLRTSLKVVNDLDVTAEDKQKTKFWKIQPLITCVRNGCLLNAISTEVCVDEQMVPFYGKHEARQVLRNKPNPVGLKNFVLASPDGLPLDFFIYEGKGDTILDGEEVRLLDIGGKVILRFASRLPPGCSVYMDRYFTSVHLLDLLFSMYECSGTGTLQKNRIPKNCNLQPDNQLRRQGRGSCSQQILSTGQISIVKWFDNKPVILASSKHGLTPTDICRRWDKKHKRYLDVPRPYIVKNYNEKMGGVDYLDRMISYYRISARTRKWTIRLIFHLFDFAIAAGWIEYKRDQDAIKTSKSEILDSLAFREAIADHLLEYDPDSEDPEPEYPDLTSSVGRPQKRAKVQHPSDLVRKKKLDHLPLVLEKKNRCRFPGCSSNGARVQCSTCGVILCLVSWRNCFKAYHEL